MDDDPLIQQQFLIQIKEKLDPNISFVDELAEDLNISNDSAYRRIRGETNLALDELQKLSTKYQISLDTLFDLSHDSVLFKFRALDHDNFNFNHYLDSIVDDLKKLQSFPEKEIIYAAKDIPIFYYCPFRELASFKIFFWSKIILKFPEFENKLFSFDEIPDSMISAARKIWKLYLPIPSLEVWSMETINVTLKQIDYYSESGLFNRKEDKVVLLDQMSQLVDHVQKQAELGYKFDVGSETVGQENNFRLYYNEVTISDNTILFKMGDKYRANIMSNVLSILTTMNDDFCKKAHLIIENIIKSSTLISLSAAKERNKFFQTLRSKIEEISSKA